MQEKVLAKKEMPAFLKRLISKATLIAPVRQSGNFFMLEPVADANAVALDYSYLYYSPKEYVTPPVETLLQFKGGPRPEAKTVAGNGPMVIFGPRPCDLNAISTYDAVFAAGTKDQNYLERRKDVALIGMDCNRPCDEYCFCADMKTNTIESGFDLLLTDIGESYFVRVETDRGADLLGKADNPSAADRQAMEQFAKTRSAAFRKRIEFDTDELPQRLAESYDAPVWASTSLRCYSCGSCTNVCPTCYCFNVADVVDMTLVNGERRRNWDSCMLTGFAEIAGGENFRKDPAARLRHRCLRKGKIIKEMFNRPGCVGCGRCERACTSKHSIVATFNQLKGGAQ